jgi:hypothetical protein
MLVVNNDEPSPTNVVCLAMHYDGLELLVGTTSFRTVQRCSTSYRAPRLGGRTGVRGWRVSSDLWCRTLPRPGDAE